MSPSFVFVQRLCCCGERGLACVAQPFCRQHSPLPWCRALPSQVSARIVGALVRTLKVTAKNVVTGSAPFSGAEAIDGGRPRLALPAGDDMWPRYFFPELLRFSRAGDLSSRHVDPRSPSVWSGRVAGVGAPGHILFREGSGAASVRERVSLPIHVHGHSTPHCTVVTSVLLLFPSSIFVTSSSALQGVPCSCGPSPHACTLETRSSPRTHRGTCVVMPPQPPSPPPSPFPGLHDRPHPKPLGAPPHVTRPLACLWECPCVMQRHGAWLPSTARAARGPDLCSCATGAPHSCPALAWVTTTVTAWTAATNRATLHAPPGGSTATRVWRSFPKTTPVGRRAGALRT